MTRTDPIFKDIEDFELETYVDIIPARWFLARNLSLRLVKSRDGWNHLIQYYPLVPRDSLIFKYCNEGNVDGVHDLIQHKLASPCEDSYTPLHVSRHQAIGFLKVLINQVRSQ